MKFLLPTPVSVAHACLAQTFFCLVIALAYATSKEFIGSPASEEDRAGVRGAAALATGVVFLQLAVGAVMRHMGAGLAIPDFPLAAGRLIPPFDNAGVAVHFAHRVGAVLVLVAVARLAFRARRSRDAAARPYRVGRPGAWSSSQIAPGRGHGPERPGGAYPPPPTSRWAPRCSAPAGWPRCAPSACCGGRTAWPRPPPAWAWR